MKLKDFYMLCIDNKFMVEIFDFKECKTVKKILIEKSEESPNGSMIEFLHEYENRYLYAIYYDCENGCIAVTMSVKVGKG